MSEGRVHSLETLAAVDGDGVRVAVFLSGCPLRCAYCHNPDTQRGAGTPYTPDKLAAKLARYKPYFNRSGGVTFSGGEPLLQARFVAETGALLKRAGINYALDTSGAVKLDDDVKRAVDGAELIILDLKFYNGEDYDRYCGGGMSGMIALGDYAQKKGKRLWLRTVIVPDLNDGDEDIAAYAAAGARWKCAERHQLLAFHTMGFRKYEEAGIENPLKDTPALSQESLAHAQKLLNEIRGKLLREGSV